MTFNLDRLRLARSLVALGAIALFVFLFFFDWYGESVQGLLPGTHLSGAAESATGWQTFTISRWVWLLAIVFALGSTLASLNDYEHDGPLPLSTMTAGLGALASALIVYRIANHPGPSTSAGSIHISYGIKPGIWFGLIAALAITVGGYLQAQAEQAEPSDPSPKAEPEHPAAAFSGLLVREDAAAAGSAPPSGSSPAPAERASSPDLAGDGPPPSA
jgi:hypothetical protein